MNYKNKNVIIENWGLLNYKYAWNKQEEILQKIIDVKINNRKINNIKELQSKGLNLPKIAEFEQ